MRNWTLRIGLMLGSLLLFALFCEVLLQLVVPLAFRPRYTRIDERLGWHHNPLVSHHNTTEGHEYILSYDEAGYRPRLARSQGARTENSRLMVIGDSFVDAAEVGDQETFVWLLDECLPGVDVDNLGVYGYSTAQELILLEQEIERYDPDLVLLLTISNDFVGNTMALESFGPAPRYLLDGDDLRFESTAHPAATRALLSTNIPAPRWIHRHSLLYYVVNHYVYQPLIAEKIERVRRERAEVHAAEDRMELYRRLVRRIHERVDAHGADLLVGFGYLRPELSIPETPNAKIRQILAEDGIRSIDLFDALKQAEQDSSTRGESLYYREDIHWNPRGNKAVAGLLAPVIAEWRKKGTPPSRLRESWDCGGAN